MENRTQRILLMRNAAVIPNGMTKWAKNSLVFALLAAGVLGVVADAHAEENTTENVSALIEPDVQPIAVTESLIDTENFELGGFTGVMHIEDFESAFITGARLSYHLSERFAFEFNLGMSEAGESSYERLGNIQVLSDDERDYTYYNFGINVKMPGESYVTSSYVLNNNLYFNLGMGTTDFAGDKRLTGVFGLGYQMLLNDWLSLQLSAKEHLFKIDVLGPEKMTYNSEYALGVSVFF